MPASAGLLKGIKAAELSACNQADSFLQSAFWGAFKARFGWEALAFTVEWQGGTGVHSLLVLRRFLAAGFSLAYIPWGPPFFSESETFRAAALAELAAALKALLPADTAFIRFDPPWYSQDAAPPLPLPFLRAGADIQAPDTVLINLEQGMEAVLQAMKPKWRYNARLALKKGITVRRAAVAEAGVFYALLAETARRDGIAIHHSGYYQTLLASDDSGVDLRLYLAEHDGQAIAGIVTLFRGRQALYLYGASSNKKRNLMAPYALQVKAMEDAAAAGCAEYDLFGIPPNEDPAHPMAGLYRFKTGFGGKIVHRPGSWDFPCRPLVYRIFRSAERLRKTLRTLKKRRPDNS